MLIRYPHVDVMEWVDKPVRGLRSCRAVYSGEIGFDLQPGQRIWRVGYVDPESGRLCERWQYVTVVVVEADGVTVALEPMMHPRFLPWRVVRRYARRVPGKSEGYDFRRDKPYAWTGSIVPEEGERVLCFEPLPVLSGAVALEALLGAIASQARETPQSPAFARTPQSSPAAKPAPLSKGSLGVEARREQAPALRCGVDGCDLVVYDALGRRFSETIYNANLAYFRVEDAAGAAGKSKAG